VVNPISLELVFKDRSHWPSIYMRETVEAALPHCSAPVAFCLVDLSRREGKARFLELCCGMYGKPGVFENHRLAPVPSLFADGRLVFDAIPAVDELLAALDQQHPSEASEK
jgi:hypothetical protein